MMDKAFWDAFARRHPIEPQVDDDYLLEPIPGFDDDGIDDSAPDFYYLTED